MGGQPRLSALADMIRALAVARLVVDSSLLGVLECLEGFIEFLKLVSIATCCSSMGLGTAISIHDRIALQAACQDIAWTQSEVLHCIDQGVAKATSSLGGADTAWEHSCP